MLNFTVRITVTGVSVGYKYEQVIELRDFGRVPAAAAAAEETNKIRGPPAFVY